MLANVNTIRHERLLHRGEFRTRNSPVASVSHSSAALDISLPKRKKPNRRRRQTFCHSYRSSRASRREEVAVVKGKNINFRVSETESNHQLCVRVQTILNSAIIAALSALFALRNNHAASALRSAFRTLFTCRTVFSSFHFAFMKLRLQKSRKRKQICSLSNRRM